MSEEEFEPTPKKEIPFLTIAIRTATVLFLILVFPVALIYLASNEIYFRSKFLKTTLAQKKFILFIYSNSPNWKSYVENNILPKIQDYTLLLNWSERNQWNKEEWMVRAFHYWGGQRDFCPMAIVFSNFTDVRIIRFYRPFLDYKHGKVKPLLKAEAQLFDLIDRKIKKEIH